MRNFSIVLIACFAVFHLADADKKYDKECLIENGLQEADTNLLNSIGKQGFANVVRDEHREKLACVLACIFRKENPTGPSLYEVIKKVISEDTNKPAYLRKVMSNILETCKTQAGDDDCKLLQCIKITEVPFYEFLFSYMVARELEMCFVDNGLKASDVHKVEHLNGPESVEGLLKTLDEDKLACAMICIFEKQDKIYPDQILQNRFMTKINESNYVTADQKKEMIETLSKCATEAAGDNCKLVKCIKILRAPFLNMYIKPKTYS